MKTKCILLLIAPIIALLLVLVPSAPGDARPAGRGRDHHEKITAAGKTRSYLVHVPPTSMKEPMPVVIVLHGGLGNDRTAQWDSRMSEKSDAEGFLAVYPNGSSGVGRTLLTWNAGGCCGPAVKREVDDVAFLRAMIEKLETEYSIDRSRIFVSGISNGGMLAYRAGMELSDIIAAIAPVDACMYGSGRLGDCPVSVIVFHGTRDPVIPYEGGKGNFFGYRFPVMPISKSVAFWVQHDKCSAEPIREVSDQVVKETYDSGVNGTSVCLVTVKGANHAWPGGRIAVPLWFSTATRSVSATDLMWDFFCKHPKVFNTKEGVDPACQGTEHAKADRNVFQTSG